MTDPAVSNFISCWPMYRDGDAIYVQNSLIILGELNEPFDPQEPWRYVEPHREVDEDGNRISEWVTSAAEVRQFRESTWGRRGHTSASIRPRPARAARPAEPLEGPRAPQSPC
ncbi:hypothetical protein [Actinomadura sp. NAK00032]|uniref:hypothetical protein n=1 Tax=Actinomadura sp. NAK00032 TaxID=2742128 RepID=UPI0020C7D8EA|nr:hypothetical protein [Actinomadura sp. NAK00032]